MPTQLLLAGAGLFAESRKNETWKSVVDGAFIMYNGLVVPKYSRANEFEADRVSMVYMARAGFDPAAAVRLWKRAYEKEGNEPGYMSILSTHPSNKARYEALQRQLPGVLAGRNASVAASDARTVQTDAVFAAPTVEEKGTATAIFAPAPAPALAPSRSLPPKALLPSSTPAPLRYTP